MLGIHFTFVLPLHQKDSVNRGVSTLIHIAMNGLSFPKRDITTHFFVDLPHQLFSSQIKNVYVLICTFCIIYYDYMTYFIEGFLKEGRVAKEII